MNADSILFRCSKAGTLMIKPKDKNETISETTKTYLTEVFINEKYGRKKDIANKFTIKGLLVEEDSLTLYSRYKKEMFLKNEEWIKNEFISGTPDIIKGAQLIDIKSSYDIFTFHKAKESINKDYYWQLQAYMALTDCKVSYLAYCLVNTPDVLIQDEKRRLQYKMGIIDSENKTFEAACEALDRLMIYDDIPINERIIEIEIKRDDSHIQLMYEKIKECRKYMNKNLFKINA